MSQPKMRGQVLNSLKWLGLARVLGSSTAAVISVIVVRLLNPADYGVMAIALIFLGLILLLNELGFGAALLQQETLARREVEQVFGLLIVVNIALYAVVYLAAPSVAIFFQEPRISPIIQVVALRLPLIALLVIPRTMLKREMRFRAKSMVDLAGMVTASLATLILALLGYGVWALAWGVLFGAVVEVVGMHIAARYWVRPIFSLRGMRRQVTFGSYVTIDRLFWYLYTRSDALIVGRLIGNEALGIYYIAKKFASYPVDASGGIFGQVGFAAYSRIQSDRQLLISHYCKVARMASLVSFPLCFGLSAVAPEAVPIVFGANWVDAILPLQLIALASPLRQLNALNTPALMAIGRPEVNVVNLVIALAIMPAAFAIGSQFGLSGVALAWALAYPAYFFIVLMRSLPVLGVRFRSYFDAIWPSITAAGVMYGAVVLCRVGLQNGEVARWAMLGISVLVGALTYLAAIWMIRRTAVQELFALFRRKRAI